MANDNSNRIEGIGPEDYEVVYFAPELLQYANDRQKEAKDEFQTTLELAEEGDPQAMVQMGLNYLYGNIGIEKNDKKRRSYHDYYATPHWGEACSYDLCINISRLGVDATVDFIKQFVIKRFS